MSKEPGRAETPHIRLAFLRRNAHRGVYAVYIFGVIFVFINILFPGSYYPVFSINSYSHAQPYDWILTIPSWGKNLAITNYTIFLYVRIEAVSFVEGADITVRATACGGSGNVGKLVSMDVGFLDAYAFPLPRSIFYGALAGPTITANYTSKPPTSGWGAQVGICPAGGNAGPGTPAVPFPESDAHITFTSPGKSPLTVILHFENGTASEITFSLSDYEVAIQSSTARNQGVVATAEALMVAIGGAFTITDIIPKVRKVIQRRPTSDVPTPRR